MTSLSSLNNVKLAWIYTLTGENADYRILQRIEIDSFGWAEEDNLLHLQKELQDGTFSPSQATKIYLPKPSGLLRPISIIRVKDTIVYQAIANIIAEYARRRLSKYYLTTTFSNILTSSKDYPFFYRQWKYGRRRLDSARKEAFSQGYSWLGELDLASFYDVIDHDLLQSALEEFCKNEDVLQLLFSCLSEWTIHPPGLKHSHGIPQGPLPSSFIAECVLHLLDRRITKLSNSMYLRYVDDITIMSQNEKNAKQAFAQIEVICRELGLIPQVKRPIQELHDIEDLMFPEPSPLQINPYFRSKASKKQSNAARKIFLGCFYRGKLRSEEEQLISKLNFSLFNMNPDRRILNKVTGLLSTMPCVAIAMNYYLRKFDDGKHICSCLFDYLDSEPIYDFVSASCLETLNFICARGQFSKFSNTCRKFLSKKHHIILRSAAVKILGIRKLYTNVLLRMAGQNNDIYLTEHLLLALSNSLTNLQKEQILNKSIRVQDPHIALTSAYLLTSNNLKLLGPAKSVNSWATPILMSKGLTKKRVMGDRVGDIIKKRFGLTLPLGFSFRNVLNRGQYKQAIIHLNMAEGGFATNRSLWATQMDNFNQLILGTIYIKLKMRVTRGNEFGSLRSTLLRTEYPILAPVFQVCHDARLANPVPHAYSILLGTYSRDIKPRERDKLRSQLKVAYEELINKI